MEKQVIIFLKNGETLLFQDVSNMDVTDKHIAFDYFGKSTNQEKSGAFFFDNIAGWSASAQLFKQEVVTHLDSGKDCTNHIT